MLRHIIITVHLPETLYCVRDKLRNLSPISNYVNIWLKRIFSVFRFNFQLVNVLFMSGLAILLTIYYIQRMVYSQSNKDLQWVHTM